MRGGLCLQTCWQGKSSHSPLLRMDIESTFARKCRVDNKLHAPIMGVGVLRHTQHTPYSTRTSRSLTGNDTSALHHLINVGCQTLTSQYVRRHASLLPLLLACRLPPNTHTAHLPCHISLLTKLSHKLRHGVSGRSKGGPGPFRVRLRSVPGTVFSSARRVPKPLSSSSWLFGSISGLAVRWWTENWLARPAGKLADFV